VSGPFEPYAGGFAAWRYAARLALARGANEAGDLVGEELSERGQAEGDREREQVLLRRARQIGQREGDLRGQVEVSKVLLCDDAGTR